MNVPMHLTIVGGRHEVLERRFKEKKLDQLVTWRGRVAHEDCYRLASESDVFLMPSRKEPFGMVTIEAMSMGCVPLAFNTPSGSSEIIEHGQSGILLPVGNFVAWAQAIKSLHEDRDLWRQLSEGAVQRARSQFNATTMGGRLCKFLNKVKTHSEKHPAERWAGPAARNVKRQLQKDGSSINDCHYAFANGCEIRLAVRRAFQRGGSTDKLYCCVIGIDT